VLVAAPRLLAVGAYCTGTNNIDLQACAGAGVAVFNGPFSNTRSVAELVIGHAIHLLRRIPERQAAARRGQWLKDARGSNEIRGKTLGIVGYGKIGTQTGCWPRPSACACSSTTSRPACRWAMPVQPARWTRCCRKPTW
jgi:D-3-phosphoglycerate dehydrogenase